MSHANSEVPSALTLARLKRGSALPDWRPMAGFDPSKPALLHDKLNDEVIHWQPERYQRHYEAFAMPLDSGMVEWDARLLDGWMELPAPR